MIDQPRATQAADAGRLLAAGASLAVAGAAAELLRDRIALAHAAPALLSFDGAPPEQLARLGRACHELTDAVVEFLEAVQPQLVASAHERMALALAEAEHAQARALQAAQAVP